MSTKERLLLGRNDAKLPKNGSQHLRNVDLQAFTKQKARVARRLMMRVTDSGKK